MWWIVLFLYIVLSVWTINSYKLFPKDLKVGFSDYLFAWIPIIHIIVLIGSYTYYNYDNEFKKGKDANNHTSKN